MGRAVEMLAEGDAVVVDMGQPLLALGNDVVGLDPLSVHRQHFLEAGTEGEHLKPAAVGEGRPMPVHERAASACLRDDVGAGVLDVAVRGADDAGATAPSG